MKEYLFGKIWKYGKVYFYVKEIDNDFSQWFAINENRKTSKWTTKQWIEDLQSGDYQETGWEVKDLEAFKLFLAL